VKRIRLTHTNCYELPNLIEICEQLLGYSQCYFSYDFSVSITVINFSVSVTVIVHKIGSQYVQAITGQN